MSGGFDMDNAKGWATIAVAVAGLYLLWQGIGAAKKVAGAVGDGQDDAAYLREVQAMWASYTTWLATPITATVNGQSVTLEKRPLDLIMSTPIAATPTE